MTESFWCFLKNEQQPFSAMEMGFDAAFGAWLSGISVRVLFLDPSMKKGTVISNQQHKKKIA